MTDPHHHDFGPQLATKHSCPQCPIPGVGDGPDLVCPYCKGTGLVDVESLDRWQHDVDQAELAALARR